MLAIIILRDVMHLTLLAPSSTLNRGADDHMQKKNAAACQRGQVVEWFADKGYGFIKPDLPGGNNVFVHISQVAQKTQIARGCPVSYSAKFDPIKKSETASYVEVIVERTRAYRQSQSEHTHYENSDKRAYGHRDKAYNSYETNTETAGFPPHCTNPYKQQHVLFSCSICRTLRNAQYYLTQTQ